MVRHTLKIVQQMLQDFSSVSDHLGTLCSKGLTSSHLLKVTKFLVKISQFEFLVMAEKHFCL